MNIGIVTTWFERGAAYVSRQYKELLEKAGHEVFIFSRGGGTNDPAFGHPKHYFRVKQLPAPYPDKFDQKIFGGWLTDNRIDVVLFNEQREMSPLETCARLGVKTGAYIDYYTHDTVKLFYAYDFLICNTKRHYEAFNWHPQVHYLPWGTDVDLFKPANCELAAADQVTFFHSCGVSYYRKGTDLLIAAVSRMKTPARLVLHAQKNILDQLPPKIAALLQKLLSSGQAELISETVPAPGLYHKGDVYVYPSRLDGLGLTMAEALSCGLPLVIPDMPPMNEFGDQETRDLIAIHRTFPRKDGYYWPMCEIEVDHLTTILDHLASDPEKIKARKAKARQYALAYLDWNSRLQDLNRIVSQSVLLDSREKRQLIHRIASGENVWRQNSWRFKFYCRFPRLYALSHSLLVKHSPE